jgi:hypothetical protein
LKVPEIPRSKPASFWADELREIQDITKKAQAVFLQLNSPPLPSPKGETKTGPGFPFRGRKGLSAFARWAIAAAIPGNMIWILPPISKMVFFIF